MSLEPRRPASTPELAARVGLRVVHRASRVTGVISKVLADGVVVTTGAGERSFRFHPAGFIAEGAIVTLTRARPTVVLDEGPKWTSSGSLEDPGAGLARVARASRIWVEGRHDAELLERVWGDDLRSQGIVVERTDGIDNLAEQVRSFGPGPTKRLGILVDHLVSGSKEQRIADQLADRYDPFVVVRGIPFVDVWQAVRPKVLGISAWPVIPRNEDWKTGICLRLGAPDPPTLWRQILSRVTSYADIEPSLVGAVEEILDLIGTSD